MTTTPSNYRIPILKEKQDYDRWLDAHDAQKEKP